MEICLEVSDWVNGLPGLGVLEQNCTVLLCGGMVALPPCPGCAGLDKRADALVAWTGVVDTSSGGEVGAEAWESEMAWSITVLCRLLSDVNSLKRSFGSVNSTSRGLMKSSIFWTVLATPSNE